MADISKIREKVSALLKKNTVNGASEAEAMAAMNYASKLMKEHGITMKDIQDKTEASSDFAQKHVNEGDKQLNIFDKIVASAIARYTDTKAWNDKAIRNTSRLNFFGYRVDVELAEYIRDVCNMSLVYEWKKFAKTIATGQRHAARKSFQAGMALRLKERLDELKKENIVETENRALVVVKTQLVESAFKNMNMRFRSAGRNTYSTANTAFSAGKNAANGVTFNRAVCDGAQGGVKLIA